MSSLSFQLADLLSLLILDHQKCWLRVPNELVWAEGINGNFSDGNSNYFDAWENVTKDSFSVQSEENPDLYVGFVPRTESAINARKSTTTAVNTTQ